MIFILSCSDKNNLIDSKDAKFMAITIDTSLHNHNFNQRIVSDKDSLSRILNKFNHCEKEPIKFYPTYRVRLVYTNGKEITILFTDSVMNYEGLTYRLNDNIQNILGF
jgi:hypothetical protein